MKMPSKKYGLIILSIIIFGVILYWGINSMTDASGSEGENSDAPDPVVFLKSYGNFSQEDYNIYEVMPEAINLSHSELSEYMSLKGGPLVGYGLSHKA